MPKVFVRRAIAPAVTALGLLLAAGQACGQTDTRWTNAAGGNWSVPGNWDTGVPSGNFNAIIDLLDPGDGYVISVDSNFSIVGFTFDSPDGIVDLTNSTLTLSGNSLVQAGQLVGTPGGTGRFQTGIGQTATLRDADLLSMTYESRGILTIDGSAMLDVCDTGIDHSGTACSWTGTGHIRMDATSSWTIGAASTFTISNNQNLFAPIGPSPSFVLNGTLEKNGLSGLTFINNVAVTNNGTIRSTTGTLRLDTTTNFSAGTLTGGNWRADAGATLDLIGQNVATNRANITLDGAGSTFTQVDALATNDTTGTFTLSGGRGYTTGAAAFTNAGALGIGVGSTFTVSSANSITNSGGAVSGGGTLLANGTLNVQGGSFSSITLRNTSTTNFSGAADVTATNTTVQLQGTAVTWTGGGDIVLNGTSSLLNDAGSTFTITNAEPVRSTNVPGTFPVFTNNGMVVVNNTTPGTTAFTNVRVNNAGTMANPGTIELSGGHTLSTPDVVNFSAGTLTGGKWRVMDSSILDFGTQSITTNRAEIILRNGVATAQFPRLQGFLATNDTLGKLTLEAGESYTTAGNFTNLGIITVDGTAGASSFTVPFGSTLSNYNPLNKKLTGGRFVVIGQGRAGGSIEIPDLDIENIDAEVTLSGVGANLINSNNPDPNALRNLNTIDNTGKFVISDGKSILTLGDFTVNATGELGVGMDSEFEVPQGTSRLTNFDNFTGEFNDGTFTVRSGRIIAPNIAVEILNNNVVLDGTGQVGFFRRVGPNLVNGFTPLRSIGSPGRTGNFTLSGGYQLEIEPGANTGLTLFPGSSLTIGTADSPGGRLRILLDLETPNNSGHFFQGGALNMNGGLLQIDGNWIQAPTATSNIVASQITVGRDFQQNGLLAINGVIIAGGDFTVNGTLQGNATFNTGVGDFILQNGILSPGMSPGMMNIGGVADFIFQRGRFEMEIFGPAAGLDYDQINIAHSLFFVGADEKQLEVTLGGGYVPALGQTFDLVTFAEGRVGDFTDVRLPTIGFGLYFERMDTATSVRLVVVPAPASAIGLSVLGLIAMRRRR